MVVTTIFFSFLSNVITYIEQESNLNKNSIAMKSLYAKTEVWFIQIKKSLKSGCIRYSYKEIELEILHHKINNPTCL
jgi:hypothetical protein